MVVKAHGLLQITTQIRFSKQTLQKLFENRKQKYNPGTELMTKIFLAELHYSDLECTDWLENIV